MILLNPASPERSLPGWVTYVFVRLSLTPALSRWERENQPAIKHLPFSHSTRQIHNSVNQPDRNFLGDLVGQVAVGAAIRGAGLNGH